MERTDAGTLRHLSNNEANRITRESICMAFLEIISTKEFNDISISEIVRRAGVSRQSFYRNYTSKEDIVLEIESVMQTELIKKLNDPLYTENPRMWFLNFFSVIRANKAMVTILYKADLFETLLKKVPLLIESNMVSSTPDLHYLIIGSMGAANTIALAWFNDGMKESEEELADICMKFIPPYQLMNIQNGIRK